jgi:hypothetical protein
MRLRIRNIDHAQIASLFSPADRDTRAVATRSILTGVFEGSPNLIFMHIVVEDVWLARFRIQVEP